MLGQWRLSSLWAQSASEGRPPDAIAIIDEADDESEILLPHGAIEHSSLPGVNRLLITRDNKFLYAAPWRAAAIVLFRVTEQGELEHVKDFSNPLLTGVIKLAFNHDESQIAAICLRSNALQLFQRDANTGSLTPDGFSRGELTWPVTVSFSPDSAFLYVGDAGASGSSAVAPSSIVAYSVSDSGGLEEVDHVQHEHLQGLRDLVIDPQGEFCYACCSTGRCVVVYARDTKSGKLEYLQSIQHEDENAGTPRYLDGVCSGVFNEQGTRLYCISGRFRGVSGLTVFDRAPDGRLTWASELSLESEQFRGGNHLVVTHDESLIVAGGTTGNSLAVVRRDIASGELALHSVLKDQGPPTSILTGPSGLLLDQDEQRLYVAAENGSAISIFDINRARQ